jgi:hypothetical protein
MTNNFLKIRKTMAKKMYNEGKTIYIVPCKIAPNFNANWVKPYELRYTEEMKQRDVDYPGLAFEHIFDSQINGFEYYNCNYELGYYTAFYILDK